MTHGEGERHSHAVLLEAAVPMKMQQAGDVAEAMLVGRNRLLPRSLLAVHERFVVMFTALQELCHWCDSLWLQRGVARHLLRLTVGFANGT